MSKQESNIKNRSWKKLLLWILSIFGIIIVASLVFLMTADFHVIALIFQLLIPYVIVPLFMMILPFILIVVGLIIAIRCAIYYKARNKKAED
ncbi:MAG: hypothetical protein E7301_05625 [Butyrivibrio sp.]|nr:hypothetical protein [Butyrivibrio sp.]